MIESRFDGVPERFRFSLLDSKLYLSGKEFTIYHGPICTGKTHSACDVVWKTVRSSNNCLAIFTSAESILVRLHDAFRSDKGAKTVMGVLETCKYLVLDDWLLTERQIIEPGKSRIINLLRKRFDEKLTSIITTQKNPDEIKRLITDGLAERMFDPINSDIHEFKKRKLIRKNIGSRWYDPPRVLNEFEKMDRELENQRKYRIDEIDLVNRWENLTEQEQVEISNKASRIGGNYHEALKMIFEKLDKWGKPYFKEGRLV